ncbi:DUF3887 domain-containing protein [Subtercola boreus]|uniref:DUF3887 domain-containing protein n=1 Tax=Subtercola boreus TaxID=120213 RepID=A0A3E0VF95_9MICO|nr:DUF3887 domain-containing protein [Subtercola boreus]RFA07527.1 DUF3887 domain-containing protein [Subtercola boreus]
MTQLLALLRQQSDALRAAPVRNDPDDRTRLILDAIEMRATSEQIVVAAVRQAREDGTSWQEIGDALGVTRQAAFQRYGKSIDPRTGAPMNTTPLPEAIGLANTVIDDLAAGRWGDVAARFDPKMREGLPVDALSAAWAQIVGQAGSFEAQGATESARAADVTITNTPLAFEAGDFIARITFRDDQTIAGLYILDPKSA